jgi:mannose-6-phosphate isomerase-like protein (cupin superfamily)
VYLERKPPVTDAVKVDNDEPSPNVARVITSQALDAIIRVARGTNAERDLMDGPPARVAILHENGKPATTSEIHEHADDIFYVLDGSAVVTLGGTLIAAVQTAEGEWRGSGLLGGTEHYVSAGDIILIPRGTPHMRHTVGRTAALLLVKVSDLPTENGPA